MDPDAAGAALLGMVSTSGRINELPQDALKPEYINTINRLVRAHNQALIFTVQADQTGVNRFLWGYQKDGWGSGKDFGIKLSKPGYDVITTPDANLLFKLAY